MWYGFNVASCGFSINIYIKKSIKPINAFKPSFRGGSEEWADSFIEGDLIGYQVLFKPYFKSTAKAKEFITADANRFASAVKSSLAFTVHKYLSCYYTTSYWQCILWVIKDCKIINEPAFWTSIIPLKVNPEPNNHKYSNTLPMAT